MLAKLCGVTAGTSSKVQGCMFRLGLLDVAIAVCCTKVATTFDSRRRSTFRNNGEGAKFVGLERQASQWRCCNQGKSSNGALSNCRSIRCFGTGTSPSGKIAQAQRDVLTIHSPPSRIWHLLSFKILQASVSAAMVRSRRFGHPFANFCEHERHL